MQATSSLQSSLPSVRGSTNTTQQIDGPSTSAPIIPGRGAQPPRGILRLTGSQPKQVSFQTTSDEKNEETATRIFDRNAQDRTALTEEKNATDHVEHRETPHTLKTKKVKTLNSKAQNQLDRAEQDNERLKKIERDHLASIETLTKECAAAKEASTTLRTMADELDKKNKALEATRDALAQQLASAQEVVATLTREKTVQQESIERLQAETTLATQKAAKLGQELLQAQGDYDRLHERSRQLERESEGVNEAQAPVGHPNRTLNTSLMVGGLAVGALLAANLAIHGFSFSGSAAIGGRHILPTSGTESTPKQQQTCTLL